ncbi:glycosyltransferase [Halobacterium salinarum]|uniref:glycosyltransferase family 2 protein n=1 Tax=Halobacterium salinarum TaxID=2242 RepID=UPI002553484E|nr:glycosyltransferase [Halobacterium salinarum]MDL0130811.1 glycosyltransferase [Halobacterium salinarum]
MTTVSVVIPTYNRSEEVGQAIKSVLSQSFDNLECIIVDDGSSDQTPRIVRSFEDRRIKYLRHETNCGVSAARNTGIKAAKGEYIAFLDSDDEWETRKIEMQVNELQSRSNFWNSVYCGVKKRRKNRVKQLFDRIIPEDTGKEGGEELIEGVVSRDLAVHAGSTLLAEKESVVKAGGFDESMQRYEELEFLVRLLANGKMAYLDKELVTLHDSGYPKANLVEQEKRKFLQKVDHHLEEGEQNKEEIKAVHELDLAKAYFREGHWREAYQHLKGGRITSPRYLAGLIWAIIAGFKGGSTSGKR